MAHDVMKYKFRLCSSFVISNNFTFILSFLSSHEVKLIACVEVKLIQCVFHYL